MNEKERDIKYDTETGEIKKGKHYIELSNEDVPELDDFGINEDIILTIKARVESIENPDREENTVKANEKGIYKLEISTCKVENIKEDRQKAKEMGLEMNEYKDIKNKRGGGKSVSL